MTWRGAANGVFVLLALGFVLLKCLEPAPTRPQLPCALRLTLPMVGLLQLTRAMRPGPFLERFGLLVTVLLAGLALVIEYVRAVRLERFKSASASSSDAPVA